MKRERAPRFPDGRTFAFTVLDDTDVATVANVAPLYDLLHELGMRTTKTVWPLPHDDPASDFISSETLSDPHYLAFVQELQRRGFEITWHCATMESSPRAQTLRGLEVFRQCIGHYPRLHVNHAVNRENLYWGSDRIDMTAVRAIVDRLIPRRPDHYQGHVEGSAYWWGDECRRHIRYCRNLTFSRINLATVNPGMPYRDEQRPLVPWWFSASDAEDVAEFRRLLRPSNIARLEREGGFCIVATHFGKGFVTDGRVDKDVRSALEDLAQRNGWFPTVSELLDWLRARHGGSELSTREWRRMQVQWLSDLLVRKCVSLVQKRLSSTGAGEMRTETGTAAT